MGLIKVDHRDAFISYASRDDGAYGELIKGIRDDLKRKFEARFVGPTNGSAEFFIDRAGMPANGLPSDELKKEVTAAEYLLILMSGRYLDSEFCGKELDWFRERFTDDRSAALKRTFVIVLEEKVKTQHWRTFLESPERPKFVELFDEEGKPLKRYLQAENYRAVINPAYETKLDWIVETMIARIREEQITLEIETQSDDEKILQKRMDRLNRIRNIVSLDTYREIEKDVARSFVLGDR